MFTTYPAFFSKLLKNKKVVRIFTIDPLNYQLHSLSYQKKKQSEVEN